MRKRKVFLARYAGRCGCGCGAEVEGRRVVSAVVLADCAFKGRANVAPKAEAKPVAGFSPMCVPEVVGEVPADAVPVRSRVGPVPRRASELGNVTEVGTDERPADAGLVMDPECGIRPPGLDPEPEPARSGGFTFRTLVPGSKL
jgi:hypothetical protein